MGFTRNQMDEIAVITRDSIKTYLSDNAFVESLSNTLTEIIITKLCDKLKNLQESYVKLETRQKEAEVSLVSLQQKMDVIEQRSKRSAIRIYGINNATDENMKQTVCEVLNTAMDLNLDPAALEKCYRVRNKYPQGTSQRSPPVYVEFFDYRIKDVVYRKKKLLKNSKVTIREELTSRRYGLFQKVVSKMGFKQTWTNDGRIFCLVDGRRLLINDEEDLKRLVSPTVDRGDE